MEWGQESAFEEESLIAMESAPDYRPARQPGRRPYCVEQMDSNRNREEGAGDSIGSGAFRCRRVNFPGSLARLGEELLFCRFVMQAG
jgi:hypothetical protein